MGKHFSKSKLWKSDACGDAIAFNALVDEYRQRKDDGYILTALEIYRDGITKIAHTIHQSRIHSGFPTHTADELVGYAFSGIKESITRDAEKNIRYRAEDIFEEAKRAMHQANSGKT